MAVLLQLSVLAAVMGADDGIKARNIRETKISLSLTNAPLSDLIRQVEMQTSFRFTFDEKEAPHKTRVTIRARNESLEKVLSRITAATRLEFKQVNDNIHIRLKEIKSPKAQASPLLPQAAAAAPVTGKVTDEQGEPLPGVTILEKGTTNGTTSDAAGAFSLTTANNATLIVSYVGFQTQEVAVNNRTTITIKLKADIKALDEVVVVGYGTQKRATVTGSVVTVSGKEVSEAPVTNVSNALVGRLPGVAAVQRSGEPGKDGSTIRIRGVNTLGNNNPLIVVDGIPGRSMDRIDPSSIESITVLKDASAAIYGSQAANGVILITTKRGKAGKPQITINVNQGFNQPTRIPEMANAAEYATMLNEINFYRNPNDPPRYSADEIRKFQDGSDPWRYPNTDWFKEVIKPVSSQNYLNAAVSGGSEKFRYFLSLGSKFQDGFYYNSATHYKQYDFRSNIDGQLSENVSLALDISGRSENRNYPVRGAGNIFRMLMRGKPTMTGFWPNGTPGPDLEIGDNPVVVTTDATGYDLDRWSVLNTNLRLDVKIPWVKGLSVKGNASVDRSFQLRKTFATPWYLYSWDGVSYDANNQPVLVKGKKGFQDARLTEAMQDNQHLLLNSMVNYDKGFGKHAFKLMLGMESRVGKGDQLNAFRRYFISTTLDQLSLGGEKDKNNGGSAYLNARLNYFGRFNYNYGEKLLLEFVGRYDGSYIFPKNGRYGFFPGVSAGYVLSEEGFWKDNLSFIDNFKLRASVGQTGNDQIDEWQYLSSYAFHPNNYTYIFGGNEQHTLLRETRIPNTNVTWEVANQTNVGLEAHMLDNKLSLEFDVFNNKRSQILWFRNASVPAATGLTLPRQNIGQVRNKGLEYNVGYGDQIRDFKYNVSFNGSYSKNKILFWDESPGRPEWQQSTGKPIPSNPNNEDGDLYYEAIGIFKDQAAVDAYPHWAGARPGDVIFKDVDGDGVIGGNDRVRSDKTNIPRFVGGMGLNLGYRQFDFAVLLQGATGAIRYISTESGEIGNYLKDFYDNRWTPENPHATGPRTFNSNAEYWRNVNSTQFVHSTDYLRLKTLELGYNLPEKVISKLKIGGLRTYVSGFNLLTYSPDLKDFDPESDNSDGQGYPVQRVVNGGITLNF
jgi:TonB-dependent starch-binding outer membrane protein SusC